MSYALRVLCAAALGALLFAPAPVHANNTLSTTATYYHPSLHGSRMANGLPYNRWDPMIAACNWYPLGTLLKITRWETGEYIYVRVQDRGSPALTIDLSEAGFSRLGLLREGRIRVIAEVIGGADAMPPTAPPALPSSTEFADTSPGETADIADPTPTTPDTAAGGAPELAHAGEDTAAPDAAGPADAAGAPDARPAADSSTATDRLAVVHAPLGRLGRGVRPLAIESSTRFAFTGL